MGDAWQMWDLARFEPSGEPGSFFSGCNGYEGNVARLRSVESRIKASKVRKILVNSKEGVEMMLREGRVSLDHPAPRPTETIYALRSGFWYVYSLTLLMLNILLNESFCLGTTLV